MADRPPPPRLSFKKGHGYPFHPRAHSAEAVLRCLYAELKYKSFLAQEAFRRPRLRDDLLGLDPEEIFLRRHEYFFMIGAKERLSSWSWETQGGRWKTESAMRAIHGRESRYIGAKRVLRFYQHGRTPTDWHMDVYNLIGPYQDSEDLYIEEETVACRMWNSSRPVVHNIDSGSPELLQWLRKLDELELKEEIQFADRKCREELKTCNSWTRDRLHSEGVQTSTATQQVPSGKSKRARPPDGKSEVWQHFTKIHTKDADVVYAACHFCDIMLPAHPGKHGTNHLRRHSGKCRLKQHVREEEMKQRCLEEMKQKLSLPDDNADLGGRDPWDLPPLFIMGHKNQPPSLDTHSGFWKEKKHSFVAIWDHWLNDRPVYFAVKKTLEFCQRQQDGKSTETDWLMTKYFRLHRHKDRPGDFIFTDENVMCKVFQEDKDVRPSALEDLERCLEEEEYEGELCPELEDELNKQMTLFGDCLVEPSPELEDKLNKYMTLFGDSLVDEGASSDEAPPKKRPRDGASSSGESDVWHRFSKIFNKDRVLLYAVCHSCRTMLKAPVKNGTSSLRRHGKKCSDKSLVPNPVGSSSCCSSSLVLSR